MRRAFSAIEAMICVSIVAIIGCLAWICHATDQRQEGVVMYVKSTGTSVTLLRHPRDDSGTYRSLWICRIDHGPAAVPRYSEATFAVVELTTGIER